MKKVLSALHVIGGFVATWFLGEAFVQAVSQPQRGIVENLTITAFVAVMAAICRDLSA